MLKSVWVRKSGHVARFGDDEIYIKNFIRKTRMEEIILVPYA